MYITENEKRRKKKCIENSFGLEFIERQFHVGTMNDNRFVMGRCVYVCAWQAHEKQTNATNFCSQFFRARKK